MPSRFTRLIAVGVVAVATATVAVIVWLLIPAIPQVKAPETTPPADFLYLDENTYLLDDQDYWHGEILRRFQEKALTDTSYVSGTAYRLILLPTFDRPILVEVSASALGTNLKTKILDGVGGYGPGKLGTLAVNEERELTREEWESLKLLVDETSFWSTPTRDKNDDAVTDGALWLFYGRDFSVYHSAQWITPKPKSLELFRYMLRLAHHEDDYEGYWQ
jgi:hypothetical protein